MKHKNNNVMKKNLLLLVIGVLCSLQAGAQTWNYTEEIIVDGLAYQLGSNPNAAMVVYRSDRQLYSGNVTIPEKISHDGREYPVTVIGYVAFSNCPALISVVMPNTVTIIEGQAFECCNVIPIRGLHLLVFPIV
jgi:hypothetical protein